MMCLFKLVDRTEKVADKLSRVVKPKRRLQIDLNESIMKKAFFMTKVLQL